MPTAIVVFDFEPLVQLVGDLSVRWGALALVLIAGGFARRDGRLFFVGVGLWAIARAAVSTTWRDPTVVAGLNMGGVLAIGIGAACVIGIIWLTVRQPTPEDDPRADVNWPEPEARPPF